MAGLPIKTTADDIEKVTGYLYGQVGWVSIKKIGAATDTRYVDGRKLEAMRFIGLIERNESEIKLTDAGRGYAKAKTLEKKATILASCLRTVSLYESTLEWLYHNSHDAPSRNEIANYWHDKHANEIGGATGAALTDAAVFFLRMADLAGMGKFVAAGKSRDTHLKVATEALKTFATGEVAVHPESSGEKPSEKHKDEAGNGGEQKPPVTVNDRIQLNIQIHIAADTKPATVEQIFKNMKTYLLDRGGQGGT